MLIAEPRDDARTELKDDLELSEQALASHAEDAVRDRLERGVGGD